MASSSKKINQFELAVLLERASNDVDVLAKVIDLGKLTRSINAHFAPEVTNAGNKGLNLGISSASTGDIDSR